MLTDHKKDFSKLFRGLCHSRQPWQLFADFCEAAALSIANAVAFNDEREARYMAIVERDREAITEFPKLLGIVVEALEDEPQDFLGVVFQELELANHWHGQFFTPFHLARLMAAMLLGGVEEIIERKGFATFSEPACGAGAMVIACFMALREMGLNPQQVMHVEATDVDATAAHMAFVQLSLLYIPAVGIVGNTITLEMRERFYTPAHVLGGWDYRLRNQYEGSEQPIRRLDGPHPVAGPNVATQPTLQLTMF